MDKKDAGGLPILQGGLLAKEQSELSSAVQVALVRLCWLLRGRLTDQDADRPVMLTRTV